MAGSRKGVPNKPKRRLLALLQEEFPGYHPVVEMARVANNFDKDKDDKYIIDSATRFNANREVAKYVEPLLKAVEIKMDPDSDMPSAITFNIVKSLELDS